MRRFGARSGIVVALVAMVSLSLVACGKKSSSSSSKSSSGGTLVLGAEQEPDCADWIGSCSGSSWGVWSMQEHTIPRAFDIDPSGSAFVYKPSILLDGEPKLQTSPKQVITYKINPKAVWSDGVAITSEDFKYTALQIRDGSDIYDKTGYANIANVTTPDKHTAVVTMTTPYAGWKTFFGGSYGLLPSHILQGKDRSAEMSNGYSWSGGPFKIQSWKKGTSVTLVPNDKYWGPKPKLDKVVFQFLPDTQSEFQAFKSGQVKGIYPQPQIDAVDQIKAGLPNTNKIFSTETGNTEGLWINNDVAPFNDVKVRQAFAYAIDRNAIVKKLFGAVGVNSALNTFNAPIVKKYSDPTAFAAYTQNQDKVNSLMTSAGWTKNSGGIWAKNGTAANIVIKTTAGNQRRELTEQILQQQLKQAGFNLTINNQAAGDLFGDILPKGDFQLSLYAQVLTQLDPSLCNLYCSENIPSEATQFSGNNWTRTNISTLDPLLKSVDTNLNESTREKDGKAADKIQATEVVSLPLDPLPNISLRSTSVTGKFADNPIYAMFNNLAEWGIKK